MKAIEIKPNYTWWKHPIRWIKEQKMRKIMETMTNYAWEHGMKEDVEKVTRDLMIKGHCQFKPKDYFKD